MSSTTTTTTVQTGVQYGFFYDQSRCIACQTCAVACKDWKAIPAGPAKALRIFKWIEGQFPTPSVHTLFAPCYHCQSPACVTAVNGAMYKEGSYGAVLIDPTQATSANLKAAWQACPYGAITFDSDSPNSTAYKCDMCIDKVSQGKKPVCVMSCPMRALDFDTLPNLQKMYGTVTTLEGIPTGLDTKLKPSVVFKPMDQKKQLVPYDAPTALSLLGFSSTPTFPAGTIRKNTLVLSPTSVEDEMYYTSDWEG